MWFATENGIVEYDGTHWINHRADNSPLPVNDLRALEIDENKNVWMATAGGGIAIYNPEGIALAIESAEATISGMNVFPNPANGEVLFNFNAAEPGHAELAIFDVQGRKVCTLLYEEVMTEKYELRFDTNTLPAGVYI